MLGIDWIKILIHFVVFAVLAVGLYLLLYKPVLRFIRNRQESIQKGIDDGKAMQEQGAAVKAEYDAKLSHVEEECAAMLDEAASRKQAILDEAAKEAAQESEAIKQRARNEAESQKQAAMSALSHDAGKMAVEIAGEILQREISQEENDRLISECLKAWSDHD